MLLLLRRGPTQQGIDAKRVLHVDQHAHRRIDCGDLFHGQDGLEKSSPGAPVFDGDFNAHQAKIEELRNQLRVKVLLLIHGTDHGSDIFLGKLAHGCAKELFVFRKQGERRSGLRSENGICHGNKLSVAVPACPMLAPQGPMCLYISQFTYMLVWLSRALLVVEAVVKSEARFAFHFSMASEKSGRYGGSLADVCPVVDEVEGAFWEKQFSRSFPAECFSWSGIEFPGDVVELLLGEQGQIGNLWQVLAEQAVDVFADASFPRCMGMSEKDRTPCFLSGLCWLISLPWSKVMERRIWLRSDENRGKDSAPVSPCHGQLHQGDKRWCLDQVPT